MYVYGRRSWRLTLWLLARSPLQFVVIVAAIGIALLALGNRGNSHLVGTCLLLLGALALASTLWLSVRADATGITVVNLLRVYRVPWDKVRLISSVQGQPAFYRPSYVEIQRGGTWALPDGYSFTIAATAGLDDDARAVIVAALLAEARTHGFDTATAAGLSWEIPRVQPPSTRD